MNRNVRSSVGRMLAISLCTCSLVGLCAARQIAFAKAKTFPAGMIQPSHLAAADLNGDGVPDLVVTNGFNQLAVFIAKGNGTFHPPTIFTLTFYVTGAMVIADFNGDNKPDIAVVGGDTQGNGLALLTGKGDGTFNPPQYFSTTVAGSSLFPVAGDFNNDGNLDIYAGGNGNGEVLLGDGKGNFRNGQVENASGFSVAVGDFNGDGNLDIASTEPFRNPDGSNGGVAVLLGNGDGTFQTPRVYGGINQAVGVAVADLNHDNKLDLIVTDANGSSVVVFLGIGDGTFGSPSAWSAGLAPGSVVTSDFNADGNLDLAVSDFNGDGATVLPGNGSGTFPSSLDYPTGKNPARVVAADFNRDGSSDLALANYGDGTISILLNEAGTFVRLHSSANPSISGQPVIFTATVRGSVLHSELPSGTVTFMDGSSVLGEAQLDNGVASLPASLAKGRHDISAIYAGDDNFNPHNSAAIIETVR